jgi:DNA-binding CsgD family transcriptional regulator/tetratricopeptide (TPR) repeat protein
VKTTPLASPRTHTLRGRDAEIGRARETLRRAKHNGQGAVVFVSGEPGIGKSALLDRIAEVAKEMGFAIGLSKAEEVGQISPLAPLLAALRSGPTPILSNGAFAELASLDDQPVWLVDRIAEMLEEQATRSPLLVALDDVQWVDSLTAFALQFVPGRIAGSPVVWLVAARPQTAVVGELIAAASRDLPVETIHLGPLTKDAIDVLARDRLGADVDEHVLSLLEGADGNPFLAVELIDGFAVKGKDANGRLPSAFVAGIRARLATLPSEAQQLLRVGAVLGRAFSIEDGAALMDGRPSTALLPLVELAIRAGVLEDDGQRLSFRHDLFRQAVYEDIPPSVRKALHRAAAARLLESGRGALDAAPHVLVYAAPGDYEAVDILRRAAAFVVSMMPIAAAELIERALRLISPPDPLWPEVGREVVNILTRARRTSAAIAVADELLATSLSNEDAARIQAEAAQALWEAGLLTQMSQRIGSALVLDGISRRSRANLLALEALVLSRLADAEVADAAGRAALAESARVDDADAQATALRALGETARNDGRNSDALEYFSQLHALPGKARLGDEILSLQLVDRFDASHELLAAAHAVVVQGDPSRVPDVAFAQMWQDYSLGLLDDTEADAKTIMTYCDHFRDHTYGQEACLMLSRIAQLRGDVQSARAYLEHSEVQHRGNENLATMAIFMRAWLEGSDGDINVALAAARQILEARSTLHHRWRWQPGWIIAAAGIAAKGGDRRLAEDAVSFARSLSERNPNVATIAGTAAQAAGLATGDLGLLRRAVEVMRASPRPLLRGGTAADYGSALLAAGERSGGVAALDSAWEIFRRLGANGEARRVQRLLQAAGIRRRRWAVAPHRPTEGWAALTETEKRVARLIAEGHTNRSAAAQLVLSPNTVATHMRSIFGKLGVNSRLQLVRAALQEARNDGKAPS